MRSEIIGMISFVPEKYVHNMVRIFQNAVSSQLRRCVTDGQTNGQTDGIAVASTQRAMQHAVKMQGVRICMICWLVWIANAIMHVFESSRTNILTSKKADPHNFKLSSSTTIFLS